MHVGRRKTSDKNSHDSSAKQQMGSVHVAPNIEQPGQCIRNSTPPIVRPAQFQN